MLKGDVANAAWEPDGGRSGGRARPARTPTPGAGLYLVSWPGPPRHIAATGAPTRSDGAGRCPRRPGSAARAAGAQRRPPRRSPSGPPRRSPGGRSGDGRTSARPPATTPPPWRTPPRTWGGASLGPAEGGGRACRPYPSQAPRRTSPLPSLPVAYAIRRDGVNGALPATGSGSCLPASTRQAHCALAGTGCLRSMSPTGKPKVPHDQVHLGVGHPETLAEVLYGGARAERHHGVGALRPAGCGLRPAGYGRTGRKSLSSA